MVWAVCWAAFVADTVSGSTYSSVGRVQPIGLWVLTSGLGLSKNSPSSEHSSELCSAIAPYPRHFTSMLA